MEIPLNIPNGPRQRDFLDYLSAALRKRMANYRASAGRAEDGSFVASVTGPFQIDQDHVHLDWRITKDPRGTLVAMQIRSADCAEPESKWITAVHEFVTSVLATALAETRQQYFRRSIFFYIGAQLDGEYWLPGFRFSPVYSDDPMPHLLNGERVTAIDQVVDAIDDNHAHTLSNESARRQAARLSLLLNVGLTSHGHDMRWVIPTSDDAAASESIRCHLGFNHPSVYLKEMPEKGELCSVGKYTGSLAARYRVAGELQSLPPEARKILRGIDNADPFVTDAFDRGSRLYQVALVCGRIFPSVGLAYRIAAVEAISKADPECGSFSDFMKKYVRSQEDIGPILDYLWGKARSGHFHEGVFPMGEYSEQRYFEVFMDSDSLAVDELHRTCHNVTREAIVNWMLLMVPETDIDEEACVPETIQLDTSKKPRA